jgi:hypothetical protein
MARQFEAGEKFSSYADLEKKIVDYQRIKYASLWKRDSRTFDASIKKKSISADKVPSIKIKKKLKYYEIRYACIHGGRKQKSASAGKRKSNMFRQDCPFFMVVRLSEDGNFLSVRSVDDKHNHAPTEETYKYYPSVRRLSADQRCYAEKQLDMNANKEKLLHQLESDTGKSVLLKDLSNIMTTAKRREVCTRNDLDSCVDKLRRVHNCTVDICTSEENDFYGFFAQDGKMKQTFSASPRYCSLMPHISYWNCNFLYIFSHAKILMAPHISSD